MNHFLSLSDLTPDELHNLLELGLRLKEAWRKGGNEPILAGKTLAMIFQKPSLRTRVSFEMGMVQLGGYAFYLSPTEVKMGGRETVADVARVLSGYVDGIMARVFEHDHILELAHHATIPVINGLSNYNHPAQALTDLFTILEVRGRLEGLKLAYVGDGNNVLRSLAIGAAKTGMNLSVATPEGYALLSDDYDDFVRMRISADQTIEYLTDPLAAVREADIIYTDVWTSMGQEAESAERLRLFPPYQINTNLIAHAKPNCHVMHCLPAHRGEEITDEVADGPHSLLFPQAHNRLHAQKAILATLLKGDV